MGFYFDYAYKTYWLILGAPFVLSAALYFPAYALSYRTKSARTRTKEMLQK